MNFFYDSGLGIHALRNSTFMPRHVMVPMHWYHEFKDCDKPTKDYYRELTKMLTVDVNGDSKADVVMTTWRAEGFLIQTYISSGNGSFHSDMPQYQHLIETSGNEGTQFYYFMAAVKDNWSANFSVFMDDFSGDGVPDVTAVLIVDYNIDNRSGHRPKINGSLVYITAVTAKALGGWRYDAVQYSRIINETNTFLDAVSAVNCISILIDVNLDFQLDLVITCRNSNGWKVMTAMGDGMGRFEEGKDKISHLSAVTGLDKGMPLHFQDVTGDGSPDIVVVYAGSHGIVAFVSKSEGNGLYGPLVQQILYSDNVGLEGNHTIQMANLGGGHLGLLVSKIDNAGWSVWVSKCKGDGKFTPAIPTTISTLPFGWGLETAKQFILDINGDATADLVAMRTPGKQQNDYSLYVAYSLAGSTAFSAVEKIRLPASLVPVHHPKVIEPILVDVTGDGRVDFGLFYYRLCRDQSYLNFVASQGASPLDKLTRLENGFGSWTSLQYEPMTSTSAYSKKVFNFSVASDPSISVAVTPRYLLRSIDHDDGLGGTSSVTHFYAGYAEHTRGYGSLGFAQITSTHSETGIRQITDFSQEFVQRRIGLPKRLRTFSRSGVLLADQNNTWSVVDIQPQPGKSDTILSYRICKQDQKTYSETEAGRPVRSETRVTVFDKFGNPSNTSYTSSDEFGEYRKETNTTYRNDHELRWLIGLPKTIAQISKVHWKTNLPQGFTIDNNDGQGLQTDYNGDLWITRKSSATREFDKETGTVTSETLFANTPYQVVTNSTRDSRGNVIRVESLAFGESKPQTVNMEYDTSGRFQVKSCDVIGFCQYWAHGAAGQVLREATDSGDIIIHRYDPLMRETQVISSQGQGVNTSLIYCDGQPVTQYNGKPLVDTVSCVGFPNAVYVKVIQPIIGAPSYQYFDRQGRRVGATRTLKNESVTITESTKYDKFGKAAATSLPYTAGESVTTLHYGKDEFGRVVSVTNSFSPSRNLTIDYSGSNITFKDPLGRKQTHVTNAADFVLMVVGELNERLRYWYDPDGNLHGVQAHTNDHTTVWLLRVAYDEGGHKKSLLHPDKGYYQSDPKQRIMYQYGHDSRGRLVWQKDANGNNVTFEWDERGRAVATHSVEGSHYYEYSKQFPDKLVAEYSVNSSFNYCLNYTYDARGLLTQVDKKFLLLDSSTESTNGCWYNSTFKYGYDSTGRLTRIVYPTGFSVMLMYDDDNRVTKIFDMMGRCQWQAHEFNPNGQVTKEQRGNGLLTEYDYDQLSHTLLSIRTYGKESNVQDMNYTLDYAENVIRRKDNIMGLQESFEYDQLNRITKATVQNNSDGVTLFSQIFRYDEISNLISKSDIGKLSYGLKEHLHAVKQVNRDGKSSPPFTYDANGNRIFGNGTYISYNSMNKPVNITRGPFTSMFDYTLTGQLMVRRDMVRLYSPQEDNALPNVTLHTYRTTVYVDDLYHEETTRDPVLKSSTVQKHYIQTYAVMVRVIDGTEKTANDSHGNVTDIQIPGDQFVYPYTDIKGSLSLVTDVFGNTLQEYSFDVCGSPRSPRTWRPLKRRDKTVETLEFLSLDEANNLLSPYQGTDQQGYDGHEQLLDIGGDLVHMGGRLYDSSLCMFTSPDPTNDDSYSLVGYNAYAYGRFNPLSGSDPSGYGFFSSIGHFFSGIGHFVAHIAEGVGKFIVHIVDDVAKFLRKFPIVDDIITIAIDVIATLTEQFWIESVWTVINDRIRGSSWGDAIIDGLTSIATDGLGSIEKDATRAEKLLIDAAKAGLKALGHGGNIFDGLLMGVVGSVASDVAGVIDKGVSNFFTISYNNIPYLMLDIHGLASKAIEGAINAAARDAINGKFGDILKDTLQGAWNGFKNAFVQQLDKRSNEHSLLPLLNKWVAKQVPLISNVAQDFEKVTKFFGGVRKPNHYAQATIDIRTDVDRTVQSFARHFAKSFNLHTHAVYFQAQGSADFFYMHKTQLMYLHIQVDAEATETWKRHL
ncbi:uncharacterized protein LOC134185008 [Corticium candelabrum]|uniref:uncharacterized protein LOC134185008 n=1 Tax=Corticium candelabrum TaxID=121492 RepID=UPI002E2634CF|nr:uncharacterized protein LOC134185008 [Corticium candelabrum]